eukprot:gene16423-22637_t
MHARPPVVKDLVLLGGGHSHVEVLRSFGMRPQPGRTFNFAFYEIRIYSGMLPGYISGFYSYDECHIDLARLAAFSNARLVHAEAFKIDVKNRRIYCKPHSPNVGRGQNRRIYCKAHSPNVGRGQVETSECRPPISPTANKNRRIYCKLHSPNVGRGQNRRIYCKPHSPSVGSGQVETSECRPPISFDVLSIGIGITPGKEAIPGAEQYTTGVKPIDK